MSNFTSNFKEGNPEELLNPKYGKVDVRKGKTLSVIPYGDIMEASQKGAVVRILGFNTKEEHRFITIKRHYVYDPSLPFQNKKKYVYCLGEDCPLCAIGHKPNDSHAFLVEHYNNIDKEGDTERVTPKRKILLVGQTVAKQLYIKHMQGEPLSTQVISVSAIRGVPSPTYMIDTKGAPQQNMQVDKNELENFNILRPNQNDIDDAKRLAPLQGKGGYQQNKHQQNNYQQNSYQRNDNYYNPSDVQYQARAQQDSFEGHQPVSQPVAPQTNNPYTQYEEPKQQIQDPWAAQTSGIAFEPKQMPDYTGDDEIPF